MNRPESVDAQWQALPVSAVAALYIDGVQSFVRQNLLVFTGAGTGIAISDALGWREFAGIAALVLLLGLLLAMVYHRRFRYRIDDDSIRVRQGLFEQKELRVRFERVQNVGFSQPFYLKPLALRRVTLETPGAAQAEVRLPGIADADALALRDRVNGARQHAPWDHDEAPPCSAQRAAEDQGWSGDRVFHASAADLFRYGLTSNQVWLLLALIGGPAANWAEASVHRGVQFLTEAGALSPGQFEDAPWVAATLVFASLAAVALLLVLLSGLMAVVRFHGFTLTGDDERFRARFGLLDLREKTLRKNRLHSVEFTQTALGRLVGNWHAVGHQTGVAQAMEQSGPDDGRFLIPGISADRLGDVVEALGQHPWRMPALAPVHRRLRSMWWTRLCAPLIGSGAVLAWLAPSALRGLPLSLIALGAALAAVAHLRWKRWGWLRDGDRLIVRNGLIGQRWIVFGLDRCQQVQVTTSPYQRRHGLATLHLRLPHGEQTVPCLPTEIASQLANRALLAAERSPSHSL